MIIKYQNMQSKNAAITLECICTMRSLPLYVMVLDTSSSHQLNNWRWSGIPARGKELALKDGCVICTGDISMLLKALDRAEDAISRSCFVPGANAMEN